MGKNLLVEGEIGAGQILELTGFKPTVCPVKRKMA